MLTRCVPRVVTDFLSKSKLSAELNRLKADNKRLDELWSTTMRESMRGAQTTAALRQQIKYATHYNEELQRENEKLRADLGFARNKLTVAEQKADEYSRAVTLTTYDEGTARACLMQLRVMQMDVRGRTGFGVTVFIPKEVLDKWHKSDDETKLCFRDAVFSVLLERALHGMWHINSRGNISAILFAPLGSKKDGICGAVFDEDHNPHIEFARSHANDPTIRKIESAIIAAQPENRRELDKLKAIDTVLEEANEQHF
jgi:regulator of replication initiation timing